MECEPLSNRRHPYIPSRARCAIFSPVRWTPSFPAGYLMAVAAGVVVTPVVGYPTYLILFAVTPRDPAGAFLRDFDDEMGGALLGFLAGTVACLYVGSHMLRQRLNSPKRRETVLALAVAPILALLVLSVLAGAFSRLA